MGNLSQSRALLKVITALLIYHGLRNEVEVARNVFIISSEVLIMMSINDHSKVDSLEKKTVKENYFSANS